MKKESENKTKENNSKKNTVKNEGVKPEEKKSGLEKLKKSELISIIIRKDETEKKLNVELETLKKECIKTASTFNNNKKHISDITSNLVLKEEALDKADEVIKKQQSIIDEVENKNMELKKKIKINRMFSIIISVAFAAAVTMFFILCFCCGHRLK